MEDALKEKKIRDALMAKKVLEDKLEFMDEQLKSMGPIPEPQRRTNRIIKQELRHSELRKINAEREKRKTDEAAALTIELARERRLRLKNRNDFITSMEEKQRIADEEALKRKMAKEEERRLLYLNTLEEIEEKSEQR